MFFRQIWRFSKKIDFLPKIDVLLSNSMFFRQILRFSKKIFFAKKRCSIAKFDVLSSNFKIGKKKYFLPQKDVLLLNSMFFRQILRFPKKIFFAKKIFFIAKYDVFSVRTFTLRNSMFFRQILRFSKKKIFCQKRVFYCQIRCFFIKF